MYFCLLDGLSDCLYAWLSVCLSVCLSVWTASTPICYVFWWWFSRDQAGRTRPSGRRMIYLSRILLSRGFIRLFGWVFNLFVNIKQGSIRIADRQFVREIDQQLSETTHVKSKLSKIYLWSFPREVGKRKEGSVVGSLPRPGPKPIKTYKSM